MVRLLAWLVLSGAATLTVYRAGGIKTKQGAWFIWLLVFLSPIISYLGLAWIR